MKKILLVMKITTFIIFAAIMQVSASGFAQKITLSQKNITLGEFFRAIQKQTGYNVSYPDDVVNDAKTVDVDFKNTPLEAALANVLKDQSLNFEIISNNVTILKKEPSFLEKIVDRFAAIDVRGKVVNADGQPIAGATVKVQGTNKTVISDQNGGFYIPGVAENTILVISYVGYLNKEVKASENLSNVVLVVSDSKLDEVQVIAYGTTTQRFSTGNIATVSAKDIEKQPVNNPLLALQGRVPGLFITQANGLSGTGVTVRLQGTNSIGSGNDPLYIIDGVPFVSQLLPGLPGNFGNSGGNYANGGSQNGSGNPMSYLNPADIESISILKDADATAIYGSRAANGAILITTKKGKAGDTKVNFNLQTGWGTVPKKLDLLTTEEFLEMRREAKRNDNAAITSTDYDLNGFWDASRYTDWQKELIGGTAEYQDGQVTISGGSNLTQFSAGMGYHRETTVYPEDFADQKTSAHFSLTNHSANQKFNVQLTGNFMKDVNKITNNDITQWVFMSPLAPKLYKDDGSLNWMLTSTGTSTWTNPLSFVQYKYKNETENLLANAIIGYKIFNSLEFKSSFGYNSLTTDDQLLTPLTVYNPQLAAILQNGGRGSTFGNNRISSWIIEPQINYHLSTNNGKLELLLGGTFNERKSFRNQISGIGYNSDLILDNIGAATTVVPGTSIRNSYAYNSIFSRLNYVYAERYLINLTVRRDGSSRFGPENQFHNFGAIGFGWIFSESALIKEKVKWLTFGKIKGSYGTTGNDQIGDYQYLNLYTSLPSGVAYQGVSSLSAAGLPNPSVQWEQTKKLQLGLDIGISNEKILISANYYLNRSSNQLLSYQLPYTSGFSSITANLPATVQNSGLEFSASTINVKTSKISWTTNINLTIPQNKITSFPRIETSSYASTLEVGRSIFFRKVYKLAGVSPATGEYRFFDKNNNIVSTPSSLTDRIASVDLSAKYFGGFQNSFSYNNIRIDFLFQFVKQLGQNLSFGNFSQVGVRSSNQPSTVLDRWKQPGDNAAVQRYSENQLDATNAQYSDAGYSDASYLRLKNVSLSYQMPVYINKTLHLNSMRIFAQAQNLLTLTNYQGFDPETRSLSTLPTLRTITVGCQVGL